uniref:CUB domain-containing protein n=1 Tax=Angiostrongylus cantonensis TaxID=6313 RepID=A0A0K0DK49_ANGCA
MAASDAQLSRPINTVSVLRTESDRVPQLFVSQPSVELRRTRSESQLATKPLDSLSMRSTTSAGLEDEVVSVYTVSSLDSELANEKLLPSFEEISDCNDTLTQNLLTPRQKDATLTPGMTLADIEREAVASTMISRPSCVAEHVDKHAERASSIASSACFRPEDDFDDDMLLRCRPTSTRKQRLHATLRASKRRVLDLMQKRRVATASPNGDTVEIGADAIDFSAVANSDRESPLALSGKRSPVETHVVDKKEKNVLWGQSLHYDLDGTSSSPSKTLYKYLNITVHAKELPHTPVVAGTNPASTDIVQATPVLELEPSQPILLGYTSLYIPQILDDCQLTLSNYHREVYQLKPPTEVQSIFEASTPEFCRHAGYDPRLCYGDVTLGFRFFPGGFPSGAGALNTEERFVLYTSVYLSNENKAVYI